MRSFEDEQGFWWCLADGHIFPALSKQKPQNWWRSDERLVSVGNLVLERQGKVRITFGEVSIYFSRKGRLASRGSYICACPIVCPQDVCVTFIKDVCISLLGGYHDASFSRLLEVITLAQPRRDIEADDRPGRAASIQSITRLPIRVGVHRVLYCAGSAKSWLDLAAWLASHEGGRHDDPHFVIS